MRRVYKSNILFFFLWYAPALLKPSVASSCLVSCDKFDHPCDSLANY